MRCAALVSVLILAGACRGTSGHSLPPTTTPQVPPAVSIVRAARQAYETAPPGAQRVLIVGDSVAYYLGKAMQNIRTTPPLAVFDAGYAGCNMLPGVSRDRSRRSNGVVVVAPTYPCDPAWEVGVLTQFHPDVVFWVTSSPPDALWQRNRWVPACSLLYATGFRAALTSEVARLGANGAKVVLTTSAYPRFYLQGSDAAADCENPLRREVAASTGSQLVDLFKYICPQGQCRHDDHGTVLRSDGMHYQGAGGQIVARWLIDQVEPTDWRN
jgi:hypothetical protein